MGPPLDITFQLSPYTPYINVMLTDELIQGCFQSYSILMRASCGECKLIGPE